MESKQGFECLGCGHITWLRVGSVWPDLSRCPSCRLKRLVRLGGVN